MNADVKRSAGKRIRNALRQVQLRRSRKQEMPALALAIDASLYRQQELWAPLGFVDR